MDLTRHIPENDDWINEYADKIGWPALMDYYNRVYLLLDFLAPGTDFKIVDNVTKSNFDLFIKCACSNMDILSRSAKGAKSYYLEEQATVIMCR